jgi:hypothetical protein
VDRDTAERVAHEEAVGYDRAITGIYGAETRDAAHIRGLSGLAYAWTEHQRGALVVDLVSGETFRFKRFEDFQKWGHEMRRLSERYRSAEFARPLGVV